MERYFTHYNPASYCCTDHVTCGGGFKAELRWITATHLDLFTCHKWTLLFLFFILHNLLTSHIRLWICMRKKRTAHFYLLNVMTALQSKYFSVFVLLCSIHFEAQKVQCLFNFQEGIMGLIEPINTRITDPQYFLDSPHQGNSGFHLKSLYLLWNIHLIQTVV